MIRTIAIILISSVFLLAGCTSTNTRENSEATSVVESNIAPSEADGFSFVCGIVFNISNYESWLNSYETSHGKTIIVMRNVDNPAITVVYEQMESMLEAEQRADSLMSPQFIEESGTLGEPVNAFYEVKYFHRPEVDYKIFIAVIFRTENPDEWISSIMKRSDIFRNYGMLPVGIGLNAKQKDQVYLLAALEDYREFKKNANSPSEVRRFYEKLAVPDHTVISYWASASLD